MSRVLVVDDDPCIVEGLLGLMEVEEIKASGAYDRQSAESMIAEHFYPVVLADLRLRSEEEGLALLESIRRMSPRSRVATITGYADPSMEARLLTLGASIVLRKPMPADEVVAIVRELLAAVEALAADEVDAMYAGATRVLRGIAQRRFGMSPEDAEEVVQETWCLYLEKQRAVRSAKPWLAATTANLCRQAIEKRCRERGVESPEPATERSDASLIVSEALTRIDSRSRTLCELIGLERWAYDEVSQHLGLPIGSVGPLYLRAKAKLRHAVMAA